MYQDLVKLCTAAEQLIEHGLEVINVSILNVKQKSNNKVLNNKE